MPSVILNTMIVINEAYGGFGLSEQATRELARRKGWILEKLKNTPFLVVKGQNRAIESMVPRDDPDLVSIVMALGPAANGPSSKLKVKRVKIEIEIDSHDGYERIENAYPTIERMG
jgi:hypothetical protein